MTRPFGEFDDDPQAGDLREAWGTLDQLIKRADVERMDLAAQMRLIAAVGRRTRRARYVPWGAMGAAACLVGAIAFAWTARRSGVEPPTAQGPQPAKSGSSATVTGTSLPRAVASLTGTRLPLPGAPRPEVVQETSVDLQPWADPVDQQLESARAYAGEVESRWRRRSDPWSQLQEEARRLESEWNSAAL